MWKSARFFATATTIFSAVNPMTPNLRFYVVGTWLKMKQAIATNTSPTNYKMKGTGAGTSVTAKLQKETNQANSGQHAFERWQSLLPTF